MIPKTVGLFKRYTSKPNTIAKGGHVYTYDIYFDIPNKYKIRTIRVYLPSTYEFDNPNKRFKVMYMCDGQNCFDHYTSAYGEWMVDETIEDRIKKHLEVPIVVGFDCPKEEFDRIQEMTPIKEGMSYFKNDEGICYGEIYGEFFVKTIKPLIDKTFYTLSDYENTAFGGSSMGGLVAFYMGNKYKDVFSFSLCFSPAFLAYKYNALKENLKKYDLNPDNRGRFYFYVGGVDYESRFTKSTFLVFNYLKKIGYDFKKTKLVYDSSQIHHEKAWSKYLEDAFAFWLD